MRRALLALPLGLALAGCMSYSDVAYTNPTVYRYTYPTYSYAVPQYVTPQPAVVAQSPSYYYYGPPTTYSYSYFGDWDRDGVRDSVDRFPTDPRRW